MGRTLRRAERAKTIEDGAKESCKGKGLLPRRRGPAKAKEARRGKDRTRVWGCGTVTPARAVTQCSSADRWNRACAGVTVGTPCFEFYHGLLRLGIREIAAHVRLVVVVPAALGGECVADALLGPVVDQNLGRDPVGPAVPFGVPVAEKHVGAA